MNEGLAPKAEWETVPPEEFVAQGLWEGIPYDYYEQMPGHRKTNLWRLIELTPAHYRYYTRKPPNPTPSMILGRACHMAVLEPDQFERDFAEVPSKLRWHGRQYNWGNNKATRAYRAHLEAKGVTLLTPRQAKMVKGCYKAAWRRPRLRRLLETSMHEVTIQWRTDEGLLLKSRLDIWQPETQTDVDLKFVHDVSPRAMSAAAYRYGYYVQAYLHHWMLTGLGYKPKLPGFVAIETEPPHTVQPYVIDDPMDWDLARIHTRELVSLVTRCEHTGHWPGWPQDYASLPLPSYAGMALTRSAGTLERWLGRGDADQWDWMLPEKDEQASQEEEEEEEG